MKVTGRPGAGPPPRRGPGRPVAENEGEAGRHTGVAQVAQGIEGHVGALLRESRPTHTRWRSASHPTGRPPRASGWKRLRSTPSGTARRSSRRPARTRPRRTPRRTRRRRTRRRGGGSTGRRPGAAAVATGHTRGQHGVEALMGDEDRRHAVVPRPSGEPVQRELVGDLQPVGRELVEQARTDVRSVMTRSATHQAHGGRPP